jgi:transposase
MDTNIQSIKAVSNGRDRYQRHSLEFKRSLVEQTLRPGVSVARIAREHGVNANQVFSWRKLYREGLLGEQGKAVANLLPVTVTEGTGSTTTASAALNSKAAAGRMWLESPKGCLNIDGRPDPVALRLVLEHLLR